MYRRRRRCTILRDQHPGLGSPEEESHRHEPADHVGERDVKSHLGRAARMASQRDPGTHPGGPGGRGNDASGPGPLPAARRRRRPRRVPERLRQAAEADAPHGHHHPAAPAGAHPRGAVREPDPAPGRPAHEGGLGAVACAVPARAGGGRRRLGPAGGCEGRRRRFRPPRWQAGWDAWRVPRLDDLEVVSCGGTRCP